MPNGTEKLEKKKFAIGKEIWIVIAVAVAVIIIGSVVKFALPALPSLAPETGPSIPSVPSILPTGAVIPSDKVGDKVCGDGFCVETIEKAKTIDDPRSVPPYVGEVSFSKTHERSQKDGTEYGMVAKYTATFSFGAFMLVANDETKKRIYEMAVSPSGLGSSKRTEYKEDFILHTTRVRSVYVLFSSRGAESAVAFSPLYRVTISE